MDDYYEIVGVDRAASRDAIDRKIREQMRLWQRRTANADLDRRQEAERRVKQLGEARTTLLDEEKRRAYDRQLTALRASDAPPAATGAAVDPTTTGNWLDQARGYLRDNDHHSAAYAARETLRSSPNPPSEVWTILARANTGLGRLDDALFEARRAVAADSRDPDAHLALAWVHEQREDWTEATNSYETASRLDPAAEAPHLGMARSLARAGRPASAVERLERRYSRAPGGKMAEGRLLARGLVEAAEAVVRPPGGHRVGRTAELGLVQRMLERVQQVTGDQELLRRVHTLGQEVARLRRAHPDRPTGAPYRAHTAAPTEPVPTNTLAVVALVLAVAGAGTCITAPAGAILGHLARNQIRERGQRGDGIALASIIVGWLITAIVCCVSFIFLANVT